MCALNAVKLIESVCEGQREIESSQEVKITFQRRKFMRFLNVHKTCLCQRHIDKLLLLCTLCAMRHTKNLISIPKWKMIAICV